MGSCVAKTESTEENNVPIDVEPVVERPLLTVIETTEYLFDMLERQHGQETLGIFHVEPHIDERNDAIELLENQELASIGTYNDPYVTATVIKKHMGAKLIVLEEFFYNLDAKDPLALLIFRQSLPTEQRMILDTTIRRLKPFANAKTNLTLEHLAALIVGHMIQRRMGEEPAIMMQRIRLEVHFLWALLAAPDIQDSTPVETPIEGASDV